MVICFLRSHKNKHSAKAAVKECSWNCFYKIKPKLARLFTRSHHIGFRPNPDVIYDIRSFCNTRCPPLTAEQSNIFNGKERLNDGPHPQNLPSTFSLTTDKVGYIYALIDYLICCGTTHSWVSEMPAGSCWDQTHTSMVLNPVLGTGLILRNAWRGGHWQRYSYYKRQRASWSLTSKHSHTLKDYPEKFEIYFLNIYKLTRFVFIII